MQRTQRLVFANQLRGLAALAVAVSHLIGVFWFSRDFVALATFSPPLPGPNSDLVGLVSFAWFQFGPFGVAVFFLISGLVVPISLEQHSRASFLAARLLRIYPTYIAALLLEVAVLYAASVYWHRPFGYGSRTVLSNLLLVHDLTNDPTIDLVNWTLCVELKFYLLLTLIAPLVRAGRVGVLFAAAACVVAGNVALEHSAAAGDLLAQGLSTEATSIVFMFIGVLFNYRLRRLLTRLGFLAALSGMVAMWLAAWRLGALAPQYPAVTVNYGYAALLFGGLYLLRDHLRKFPPIDFMATVSFPFYLIHSMIGYSLLKLLMLRLSLGYVPALLLTIAGVLAIAAALHVTVERPTIRMGRILADRARVRIPALA